MSLRQGNRLEDIVTLGDWVSSSTFQNNRRREHLTHVDFTNVVLDPSATTILLTDIVDMQTDESDEELHDAAEFT
jgi:hypothetical protein